MADFTALKTAIQNAIKQNGNEEITGNILQEMLLAIVTTLGDGSINDLITALSSEAQERGNADTALSNRLGSTITAENTAAAQIGAEAEARAAADTALQGLIDGLTDNIENGYVYAGIATPSSTPVTGKVFYLALTAGTYTNFGNIAVTQGINILKYNGSAWSLDAFIGIDDTPTPNSPKLVKSGGTFDSIMTDGSAFDISAHFASGGTLATYADLSAALTALNTLSTSYKRGGMSIKYVQSSDNKYVKYRLMSDEWSTTVADWQGVDDVPTAGSNNLIKSGGVAKTIKPLQYQLNGLPIPLDVIFYGGGFPYQGNIVSNAIYKFYYIRVVQGEKFTPAFSDYTSSQSVFFCYTEDVPAIGVAYTDLSNMGVSVADGKEFTALKSGYFLFFVVTEVSLDNVTTENDGIKNQFDQLKEFVDEQFDDSKYVVIPYVSGGGGFPYEGSIVSNGTYSMYYIPVTQGEEIKISVSPTEGASVWYGFTLLQPSVGVSITDVSYVAAVNADGVTFTSQVNGYFVIFVIESVTVNNFKKINDSIVVKVESLEEKTNNIETSITIGAGETITSIKEGFEYARANNIDCVYIKAGTYDLVSEGISGVGYILPKKVVGYGAILVCNLLEEDWNLSPLNVDLYSEVAEVYGLKVVCSNCRYCIHDDMGGAVDVGINYYRHVFKDLTLIHNSPASQVLIAPNPIGGGFGEGGDIKIDNCNISSETNVTIDYHSSWKQTQSKEAVARIIDCILNKPVTCTSIGTSTTYKNKMYVSGCMCPTEISDSDTANAKLIGWNNAVK